MSPDTPTSPKFFEAASRAPTSAIAQDNQEERTLDQLHTPEQVLLLDTIDELRNQGLDYEDISLPQLIVCGDQSTGKSSVLEGLTRLRFPTNGVLCTTFATEVSLRSAEEVSIICTIIPGRSRTDADRKTLMEFEESFPSSDDFDFPKVIGKARIAMALGKQDSSETIYEDVLRVKYSGPSLPSLTVVDLPGMILQSLNGGNSASSILGLVTSYMCKEKSIILAVVQAGCEPECQRVFIELPKFDPDYSRTLGIITKPDMVHPGSDQEKKLIRIARNEAFPLRYRWHAVRNRADPEKSQPDSVRDELERKFFSTGSWATVARADVGIESLRTKLSRVLLEHVGTELPSIVTALHAAITNKRSDLKALGESRETIKEQRAYLISHAQDFHSLTQDALRGVYTSPFFSISSPDQQTPTRLRTAVQNLNMAFADVMYRKGNKWYIPAEHLVVDESSHFEASPDPTTQEYDVCFPDPQYKDRAEFLENHIGGYVRQSRQSGLPSVINPLVIGEVFREMSESWREIAKHHLRQIFGAIQLYVTEALESIMDPYTFNLLKVKHIQPELDRRWEKVEEKLEELLVPYTEQDPLTYDPGFVKTVKDLRAARYSVEGSISTSGKHQSLTFGQSQTKKPSSTRNQRLLIESLDDFTNSDILDLVTTYYKSAISIFISNVAVLAVENCLMKNLPGIFSATLVANMDDAQLRDIAAESEVTRSERSDLKAKLSALESGKRVLSEYAARAAVPSMQKACKRPLQQMVENRPRATVAQTPHQASERPERPLSKGPETMADLASKLNNLIVTPPPSGSNTRESSRRRVDSVTRTPPKAEMQKQRNRIQNVVERQPSEYESDSEY